jgi:putative flippase GtrA
MMPSISIEGLKALSKWRVARFGTVAGFCASLHLGILVLLVRFGTDSAVANGLGFGLSGQVNFVLSALFTWGDRSLPSERTGAGRTAASRAWAARWAKFNTVAVGGLIVNELVFTTAMRLGTPLVPASLAGIVTGGIATFLVNDSLTFRDSPHGTRDGLELATEQRPGVEEIRMRLRDEEVAFFMPAFNEAANLRVLVPRIVDYFNDLGCPFTVVVVNDGSTRDDTHAVVEHLVQTHPGQVRAVHHESNRGYGAALRSGIGASLETGHRLIGFCDADNQYEIESFGTLLAALQDEDAHLAVGYRISRADPLKRRLMGRGWHWLTKIALGFATARDVDCGFKLFTREVLLHIAPRLRGDHAEVSPELLARATSGEYRIAEAGVAHLPRTRGRQTGSSPKVVVTSLVHLFQLRRMLRKEAVPASEDPARPSSIPRDGVAWAVGFLASAFSVAAYVVTEATGTKRCTTRGSLAASSR